MMPFPPSPSPVRLSNRDEEDRRIAEKLTREMGPEVMRYLQDPTVTGISLNPDGSLWVKQLGQPRRRVGRMPASQAESMMATIAAKLKVTITAKSPILECELPLDGSRFTGMIPPIVKGPSFTIRKHAVLVFSLAEYVEAGTMTVAQRDAIDVAVRTKKNILVVGGTDTGKTTLANAIIRHIADVTPTDRLIIIEDTTELQPKSEDKVSLCVGVMLAVFTLSAQAQTNLANPGASANSLLDLIKNSSDAWFQALHSYALYLFWTLAVIQLMWTLFPLVLKGADVGELLGEFVRYILTIGFFAWLLEYSQTFASAIVESFRQAGAAATAAGTHSTPTASYVLNPGDLLARADELSRMVSDAASWYHPIDSTLIALVAVIVHLCFAFIAALIAVTLAESYIVVNAAVLFMGFGGSQWTREYAIAMIRYAVSVGAKLFVLTLLVGLFYNASATWLTAYKYDDASLWTLLGLGLMSAYRTKRIPDLIQGLISGTLISGGATLGGMAMAAATMAAATVTAGGSAAAGGAASTAAGSGAGASSGSALQASITNSLAGGAPTTASSPGSNISNSSNGARPTPAAASNHATSRPIANAGNQTSSVSSQTPPPDGTRSSPAASTNPVAARPSAAAGNLSSPAAPAPASGTPSAPPSTMLQSADAVVRTFGGLAALSVPGMEQAHALSLGPQPGPSANPDTISSAPGVPSIAANVIAPAPPPADQSASAATGDTSIPPDSSLALPMESPQQIAADFAQAQKLVDPSDQPHA